MVFDDAVRIDPTVDTAGRDRRIVRVLHVDPTPLPRMVAADLDNSAERLGHPPRRQKAKDLH